MRRLGLAASILGLAVVACAGGPSVTPAGTPAVTLPLSAQSSKFDQSYLAVPAGSPFGIQFENKDTVPHNVSILGGPAGMSGEVFSGPGGRTYVFAALPAGSYTFHCDVHPEMTGTVQAT